jgi:deoxyribonuclease IV
MGDKKVNTTISKVTSSKNTMTSQRIRVRQLLSAMNGVERAELKKLLPAKLATNPPEEPAGTRYPAALLSALPKEEAYSLLGWITEDLLHYAPVDITMATLETVIKGRWPEATPEAIAKIAKSKTTEPYLNHIRETRKKVRFEAHGALQYEQTVGCDTVEGHPDMRTADQVFEVKMTGQLKQNWVDFLFQVFAYAALAPEVTDVYLVLPLQEIVWHHSVNSAGWPKRPAFLEALRTAAAKKATSSGAAAALIEAHQIGSHQSKLKSLVDTVHSLPVGKPAQIFLAGPQSSRLNIAEAELVAANAAIQTTGARLFIHSPYIINLCTPTTTENEDYHTKLLIKNLQYGVAMGARGVVVHVGKSTTQAIPEAMATMRANLLAALPYATTTCPILLETPAGQGTEVLKTSAEFLAFVADIGDPRLRICIDTCHVFACGEDPESYLAAMPPAYTKLIHFNDSATPCGSCLDRHAFVGEGHIGIEKMTAIAVAGTAAAVPMVIE